MGRAIVPELRPLLLIENSCMQLGRAFTMPESLNSIVSHYGSLEKRIYTVIYVTFSHFNYLADLVPCSSGHTL